MKRPGGEVSRRFLDLNYILDRSGTMNEQDKIGSLNKAGKETIPYIRRVQEANPAAMIRVNVLTFGHGAGWTSREPVPIDNFEWKNITADDVSSAKSDNSLEVVFLIDTSGSMSDEIDAVKKSCEEFARTIEQQGLKVKLGLVGFDIGGYRGQPNTKFKVHSLSRYTIGVWNLSSPSEFKKNIQDLSMGLFGGGGCYLADKDSVDIFPHVTKVYGEGGTRVLVVISDETGGAGGLDDIVKSLSAHKVTTYVLGVPGAAHEGIAKRTGGEFWDISKGRGKKDFSSILVTKVAETIGREAKKFLADGSLSNGTDMGAAIRLLTDKIRMDKMPPRCLPPVSIMVSDGQPTDDFTAALHVFAAEPWAKKMVRLAIAIGDDCDLSVLQDFIGNKEIKPLKASNTSQLIQYFKFYSTAVLSHVSNPAGTGLEIEVPHIVKTVPEPADEKKVW
ncbi:MAG: VWA domain-containing protein [Bacteroidota bacterium]